jgi:hypothetical protein
MVGFPGTLWGLFEMHACAIVQALMVSAKYAETLYQQEQREKLLNTTKTREMRQRSNGNQTYPRILLEMA